MTDRPPFDRQLWQSVRMRPRPPGAPAELESFLEGLAEARIVIDSDYRIVAANRAYRDAYAQGASPVGRRCYEVSHGFTQPCDRVAACAPRLAAFSCSDGKS